MRRTTTLLVLTGLLLGIGLSRAEAASPSPYGYVVGDSITKENGAVFKARYHPSFDVDGKNGRHVNYLTPLVRARMSKKPTPRWVVMALGTNEVSGWSRAKYVEAVNLVPRTTKIIMITPYRDPAVFGAKRAATMNLYASWMRSIASSRSNVCNFDWNRILNQASDKSVYLRDGVHTTPEGQERWVTGLQSRFALCA